MNEVERTTIDADGLVCGVEAVEDIDRDRDGDVERHACLRAARVHQLVDGEAGDVLHDEEEIVVRRDDIQHLDHVPMPDAHRHARLVEEHHGERLVLAEVWMKPLDGDGPDARPLRHAGEVNGAHAARSELFEQRVRANDNRRCA
jgi:hypothetical protein